MDDKAIAVYSLFLILIISLLLAASVTILRAWGSTNRCLSLQSSCESAMFWYCSKWISDGTQPDIPKNTDTGEPLKTCKVEEDKKEIDCPIPDLTLDKCRIMIYGSAEESTTIETTTTIKEPLTNR
jgi:hypothetical protein